MNKVTTLNPILCPKTIQRITEMMDSKGVNIAVYKGLRYFQDEKGMHVVALNATQPYENFWTDLDFNN